MWEFSEEIHLIVKKMPAVFPHPKRFSCMIGDERSIKVEIIACHYIKYLFLSMYSLRS